MTVDDQELPIAEAESPPAEQELPLAEESSEPARMIENIRGRLGLWPVNVVRARVAMPWKRRFSKAALQVPRVRYWEKRFMSLSDDEMLEKSMELRGKARGKWDLDSLLPEAF